MSETLTDSRRQQHVLILFALLVVQVATISISIAASSVAFGLSLLFVIYWSAAERRWLFFRTPLDYFFLAYVCIELTTITTAIYPAQAAVNAKRLLLISVIYLVLLSFDSRKKILRSLFIIFAAVAAVSIIEIAYYYIEREGRLYVFQHYMTTGGLKMITCLLIVPFLLHKETPAVYKRWMALFFVPSFIALILTNTRSSWVGFLAGFVVISLLKNKYLFFVLVAFLVLFFLFAPATQVHRAKSIVDLSDPTNHSRLVMWSTGLKIFADHPLLGVGDSDMHEIYDKYRSPDDTEVAGHLHNNFVMLLVTLGIVGLTAVVALFLRILIVEFQNLRSANTDWLYGSVTLGAFAVFIGFLVNGLFEWNFGSHQIMVFTWFTVGLSLAMKRLLVRETA
ncbi:MAG TPA: O-antigen ligase family protein [Bacteroidota bacterium]|nr:O-antigen ligase family protein [Bacteroidota bacterium]